MKKSPINTWQALIGGLLIIILVTIDTSSYVDGQIKINSNRTLFLLINYVVWSASITLIYKYLLSYELNRKQFISIFIPRFLAIILTQFLVSNVIFLIISLSLYDQSVSSNLLDLLKILPKASVSRIIDLLVITGILKVVDSQRRISAQKFELAEVKNQLTQSKLDALQMQLNPHFLFNALHAIHSLIGHDNRKSRKMLLEISQLLRKILELGNQQLISLEEELELFKTYLAIEEERFHDRLTVTYEIDPQVKDTLVPSLLLQPLLENALKHGISLMEGKGEICLNIAHSAKSLNITLGNSYDPNTSAEASTGIGLQNIRKRLETLFPNDFKLSTEAQPDWFEVKINIPRHDI